MIKCQRHSSSRRDPEPFKFDFPSWCRRDWSVVANCDERLFSEKAANVTITGDRLATPSTLLFQAYSQQGSQVQLYLEGQRRKQGVLKKTEIHPRQTRLAPPASLPPKRSKEHDPTVLHTTQVQGAKRSKFYPENNSTSFRNSLSFYLFAARLLPC